MRENLFASVDFDHQCQLSLFCIFQENYKPTNGKMPWQSIATLGVTVEMRRLVTTCRSRIWSRLSWPPSAAGGICWWMWAPLATEESCRSWRRDWNKWGSGWMWTVMLFMEQDRGHTRTTRSLRMCGEFYNRQTFYAFTIHATVATRPSFFLINSFWLENSNRYDKDYLIPISK